MTALDIRSITEKDLKSKPFPAVRQELRIVIAEEAFDRAVARGDKDMTREIGGVLVGEILRDESGPYLRIDTTIDALHAEEKGAELTFTHATWEHVHKEMDSKHEGKKIIGWYHTHPGFGIFLSDRDRFIQTSFFNLPFQIALVYDPKSREHGVFIWRDNEPSRCRRYWVGTREHLWDGQRMPHPKDLKEAAAAKGGESVPPLKPIRDGVKEGKEGKEGKESKEQETERTSRGDRWANLIGGVALLLLGGMGGWWMGVRGASDALRNADLEIARARSEGSKSALNGVDAQLIGILRNTVGNEAVRRPAEQMLADLDEAEKALDISPWREDPDVQGGLAKLRRARQRAVHLRDDRGDAYAALTQLEELGRRGTVNPADIAREINGQRNALGGLYSELAGDAVRAGDLKRAKRLLAAAASVDPGNRNRYLQQLDSFESKGELPAPARGGAFGPDGNGEGRTP